jgi:GntR family transcriptional repressor for pyruvate dehydrogenase complex
VPRDGTVSRSHSAAQIIEVLRDQIARGELPRGSRLPSEKLLGEHFLVSAPTVREAIRALAALGLVESRHGSGTYVTAYPAEIGLSSLATAAQLEGATAADIIQLLETLNVGSVDYVIQNATADDIVQLANARDAIVAGQTREEILFGVESFLRALAHAAHRPLMGMFADFLVRTLVVLEIEVFPESATFWRDWTKALADLRAEIVEAVAARDADRLRAAVSEYHSNATGKLSGTKIDREMKLSDPRFATAVAELIMRR